MNGKRLTQKVAIVTGSTSGIGRASAELFAEEGASVVLSGRRREQGMEVEKGIRDKDGTASYFYADLSKSEDIKALIQFTLDTYGKIDILMNNAYSGHQASVTDLEEADWDASFAIILKAPALASKHTIPAMIKRGGGSIINVTSSMGLLGGRGSTNYGALKAGLINLTRHMAVEYGRYGIRVNAICPGRIVTEEKVKFLKSHPEQVRLQKLVYPLGRPGTMREAAMAALFLASDESSFITGQNLAVDGGLTVQLADSLGAYLDSVLREEMSSKK